jgi:microcin C transport system substrate-binding protein
MRLSTRFAALALAVALSYGLVSTRAAAQDPAFDPAGWTTDDKYPAVGDPAAKRVPGSRLLDTWESFPPTLRTDGPNSNLIQTRAIHILMFETLVQMHPNTGDFVPCLATHWKIETAPDNKSQTFWFHINPKARFSDGSPVTAEDVRKTWWHRTQDDRVDPSSVMTFSDYEEPVVVDRLTVKVKTKELNWRQFLYFGAGMYIHPAKEVSIPGKDYLENWNWKLWTGSGPYLLKEENVKKGDSVTVVRRNDWWAENETWAKNTYNFDQIKFIVVRDAEMQYEMFKKGELDWYVVNRAKRWVDEMPKEEIVKNGWVKRRKIYTDGPQGFGGIAFNMREKPFDDKRVRLAFAHLFNREKLMEKMFYNEYDYLETYFPGGGWGAKNGRVKYDPDTAEELLAQAGFKERDADGFLVGPDGKRFEVTLELGSPTLERIFAIVKEDFEKAGVQLNLKVIDGSTLTKKVTERQFKIHFQSWGGLVFPNPETSWRSKLADEPANNNLNGFKNKRVDELCDKYNVVLDRTEQKKIIQEIDRIIFEEHPYALGWYAPYERVAFWDKFGYPSWMMTRLGDQVPEQIMLAWWPDPEREKAMLEAKKAGRALPQGEVILKPWEKQ